MNRVIRVSATAKRILLEMARNKRPILLERHPRKMYDIQYILPAFPREVIRSDVVNRMKTLGYLELSRRGYYILSTKGQLMASKIEIRLNALKEKEKEME